MWLGAYGLEVTQADAGAFAVDRLAGWWRCTGQAAIPTARAVADPCLTRVALTAIGRGRGRSASRPLLRSWDLFQLTTRGTTTAGLTVKAALHSLPHREPVQSAV
jgi:hypothetical protein